MKTDDDLARSTADSYKKEKELITQLNYQPSYTEREGYQEEPLLETGLKHDLVTSQRNTGLSKKTRNDYKRIGKLSHKHSNVNNYSSSSIFSLSQDETIRSGQYNSKYYVINYF